MKRFWDSITPCVRIIMLVSLVVSVALYAKFRPVTYLFFDAREVADGQVWRLLTHAIVGAGMVDFITGMFLFAMLGPRLELTWGKSQFLIFLGATALLTGVGAWAFLPPYMSFIGLNCFCVSVLVGWWRMFPYDQLRLIGISAVYQVREIMKAFIVINHIIAFFNFGVRGVLLCFISSISAWYFISVKEWLNQRRRTAHTPSKRMSGLEL